MQVNKFLFVFFFSCLLLACVKGPYYDTNKAHKKQSKAFANLLKEYPVQDSAGLLYATNWVGTTNFSMRKPNFVIIHHTAQNSCEQTLKTFTLSRTAVSAHYVICKDGTVHHMLNDLLRAHHAGVAKWGQNTDLNSSSIGIELDNNGYEYFSEAQMNSLQVLLGRLKAAYNIPTANFIGHGDIAPTRKNDPNWRFPWKQFATNGFGHWYDNLLDSLPTNFNALQSLRLIGFDTKDTSAAKLAFKRHFLQDTTKGSLPLSDTAKLILYNLSKKY